MCFESPKRTTSSRVLGFAIPFQLCLTLHGKRKCCGVSEAAPFLLPLTNGKDEPYSIAEPIVR